MTFLRLTRPFLAGLAVLAAATAPATNHAADSGTACGLTARHAEEATALVQALVARGHAPGAVLDLRCNGQPWLQRAVGLADVARQRPQHQDDLFRIYSMSKPVTSVLVLMLAEEGRLSLDDPVARHLPEFAAFSIHDGSADMPPRGRAPERPLTVRDLLRHSAGISYTSALPDPVHRQYVARGIDNGVGTVVVPGDGSPAVDTLLELSRRIAAIAALHTPGARFSYGNSTDVLGRLVEAVTGQRLRDALRERLLQPLAMADTAFEVPAAQSHRLTAAYAAASALPGNGGVLRGGAVQALAPSTFHLADDPQKSVFVRPRLIDFGGAGLLSTAADYQRFLALLLNRGEVQGRRLLRRDTVAAMTTNQLDIQALAASPSLQRQGLGFGLGVATFAEPARAPGAVPLDGYFWGGAASTYFWVDPARGITGVLMAQVFGGDVAPYYVQLLDLLQRPAPAR